MKSWYYIRHLSKNKVIKIYFYKEEIGDAFKHYLEIDSIDNIELNNKYDIRHFNLLYGSDVKELESRIKDIEKVKNKEMYYEIVGWK